ncbi:TraR/DksA family transcriptional regulator [Microbacterium sp.]|uniref:TraR/DksA family transcriptional regulator n=1 Tax=Microbacterium sp. TaxID=51671 RepID=UPI003A890E73
MDAAQRLRARERDLLDQQSRLTDANADLRRDRADGTADDEHDPEGSTLSGEWQRVDALRASLAAEIASVRRAQVRVADGSYGVCEVCGRGIPPARLEARPHAATCVDCAGRA